MSRLSRIVQAQTLLVNLLGEGIVAAALAALIHKQRRVNPKYSLAQAAATLSSGELDDLAHEVTQGTGYDLYLSWTVERLLEARLEAQAIPVDKVAELRRQGKPTNSIFETHLSRINDAIRRQHGVLYCYNHITGNPDSYDTEVLKLISDAALKARQVRRIDTILRSRIASYLLFGLKAWHVILFAFVVTATSYVAFTLHTVGATELVARTAKDAQHIGDIWLTPDVSLFQKLSASVAMTHQLVVLLPSLLLGLAAVLPAVRTRFVSTNLTRKRLATVEDNLRRLAQTLRVPASTLLTIKDFTVQTKITNIGTIGQGAIVNIEGWMQNVSATVGATTQPDNVKQLFDKLALQVKEAASQADQELLEQLTSDLETLGKELTHSKPRKKWYEVSLTGLKEAAEAIGEIGKPILETVGKLAGILLR